MVAQQPQLQIQTQQPTPSPQDEALKRNTDCVYFLASPLTCKKGNECEYRHSEYARVNPRDCWYWLNGNCLNPKCSFRHPPLDGLLGTPPATAAAAAAAGPSVPAPQIAATSATHAPPYNASKQAVPCIFFQKGFCLKGDRCAFLHGPNPTNGSKIATQGSMTMTNQGAENPSFKKPFGGIEKHAQERKTSQANVAGVEAKPVQKSETAPQKNMFKLVKHVPPPPAGFDDEASRFKTTTSPPPTNGPNARSNRVHQPRLPDDHSFHSGNNDEFLRESSPGFDVLVADELRNSDYYHGEDEFGKTRGQDERGPDSLNEYDVGHSADYSLAADIDRDRFRVPQGYDSYDHMQEPYGWEPRKGSAQIERRTHHRSRSPDSVEVSDLRHRLSKRRKGNSLKSVVAHDEEQSHRFSRKDSHQLPSNERSVNNRFRGRINLPPNGGDSHLERDLDRGRTSSHLERDLDRGRTSSHLERDLDRGRISGRLSSGRLQSPHEGSIQDRLRGRLPDDERRNFSSRSNEDRSGFSAPKSLAELKYGRNAENNDQQSFGKRKSFRDHQQYEDDVPFEGPKPLSEILKEKKGVGAGAGSSHSSKHDDNKNEGITENGTLSESKEEESKIQAADGVDNTDVTHGQSSEEGMIYDEAAEDQEYEGEGDYEYEQGDEEYEYEQVEGENQEQEYMEDEDGDDFAKKIGVVLS